MEEKERESEWVIERKKKQHTLPFPDDDGLWQELNVWDLLRTFSSIISSLSSDRIIDLYEEVSVNEKISLLDEILEDKDEFPFTDLIRTEGSIMEIVCSSGSTIWRKPSKCHRSVWKMPITMTKTPANCPSVVSEIQGEGTRYSILSGKR